MGLFHPAYPIILQIDKTNECGLLTTIEPFSTKLFAT